MLHRMVLTLPALFIAAAASGCDASACGGDALCAVPAYCAECRDEKCGDIMPFCEDEPDCVCMSDCMGRDGIPGVDGCLDACALDERPASFAALEECAAVACPDEEDECATPPGYVFPDGAVLTTTDEIGDGAGADCGFDDTLAFDPLGDVLQFASADGAVCAKVVRDNRGPGDQANTAYALSSLTVGPLGRTTSIDDAALLCWYASHHNFADIAHAWTGTRHFDLRLEESGHGGARSYELSAFEQGPFDPADCAPIVDGAGQVGETLKLFPYPAEQ